MSLSMYMFIACRCFLRVQWFVISPITLLIQLLLTYVTCCVLALGLGFSKARVGFPSILSDLGFWFAEYGFWTQKHFVLSDCSPFCCPEFFYGLTPMQVEPCLFGQCQQFHTNFKLISIKLGMMLAILACPWADPEFQFPMFSVIVFPSLPLP